MNKVGFMCIKGRGECDGCMDCKPDEHYYCPICGAECYEAVYVDNNGTIIGCENCAEIKEPWEVIESETD